MIWVAEDEVKNEDEGSIVLGSRLGRVLEILMVGKQSFGVEFQ